MERIKEKLNEDIKSFMKNKETVKLNIVRKTSPNSKHLPVTTVRQQMKKF